MKTFILTLGMILGATTMQAQVKITTYGKASATIEKDFRGNEVTTISCDSFYNQTCFTLETNGPVVTDKKRVQLNIFREGMYITKMGTLIEHEEFIQDENTEVHRLVFENETENINN